ncbi:ELMO domain-containing protein 2 [Galdieria sulphuraria]|nr:ELMO domain-containing protein 2 [Galdieria sulphuraria]
MSIRRKRKVFSDKREIEVICQSFAPLAAHSFFDYLRRSKQLAFVWLLLKENPSRNKEELVERILQVKDLHRKSNQTLRENIQKNIQRVANWFILVSRIKYWKETRFSKDNEEHKAILEELWDTLTKNQEHLWKDWTDIGFQGKDPSTDFRGAGLLSLLQLVYFAKKYFSLCQRVLYNCNTTEPKYPFACTGIYCTEALTNLLEQGILLPLGERQSDEDDDSLETFHEEYVRLFLLFHHNWHTDDSTSKR